MLSFVHLEVLTVRMHALGKVVLFYFIFYLLVFLQTTQQLYHLIYPVFLAVSFSQTLSAYILYSSHLGKLLPTLPAKVRSTTTTKEQKCNIR